MKKLLLSLIITTSVATSFAGDFYNNVGGVPNLGITNGVLLSDLINKNSSSQIAKLAKATVGLYSTEYLINEGECTGVAISNNTILTAQHCVRTKERTWFKVGYSNDIYTYDGTKSGKKNSLKVTKITLPAKDYQPIVDADSHTAQDLAMVTFSGTPFKDFVSPEYILANTKPLNVTTGEVSAEILADKLFNGNGTYYQIGWGGKSTLLSDSYFNYKSRDSCAPKTAGNNNDSMPTKFGSLSQTKDASWNTKNIWTYGDFSASKCSVKTINSSSLASNPGQIILSPASIHGGDSGGPLFLCKGNLTNGLYTGGCWLTGIVSSEGGGANYASLVNPYYDVLALGGV